jgi:hypothetical protein
MKEVVLIILLNIFFLGDCIANTQVEKILLDTKTKELIKGKSKKWIIIDGVGIGLIINSSKESENIIDQKLNQITNAHGKINPPDSICMGKLNYFKGSILDIFSGETIDCGEGRVIKYENASPLLQKLSNLLLLQERIRSNIHNPKTDLNLINKDIFKSVKELSSIVKKIKAGDYGKINKESIIQGLNEAIKLNLSSVQQIQRKEKIDIIFKSLSQAYDKQVSVINKVIKAGSYY